ncbi:hypothetical protein B0J14DRAFT_134295 [Halenospora varia]|nr:hypothetical protein B0J14DRAFT_134295 [Halenospora varia]
MVIALRIRIQYVYNIFSLFTCSDVNATTCCPNSQYCVINTDNTPGCCAIGSNCGITCGSSAYICQSTATVSGTQSVVQACCPRSCPTTSQYKCASAYGGGCCSFGFMCTTNKQCVSSNAATTSNPLVSIVPSGCTTNQYACATSLGGGCCDNGLACTVSNNINYCAATTGTAVKTRTGPGGIIATEVPASSGGGGLSTGAKAGIGAGIGVGALVTIGILIWFVMIHRRNNKMAEAANSAPAMSQGGGSSKPGGSKRPSQGRQASDYFGPSAAAGPFTEDQISTATSPIAVRGGPGGPHSPGDIASPVEIDSQGHSQQPSPGFEYMKTPTAKPVELP